MNDSKVDLGPDETMVAQYRFAEESKRGMTAILTSKRLVILQGKTRETHPLTRIRAVRIESGRSWGSFVTLIICAAFFASAPIFVARMTSQLESLPQQLGDAALVQQGNMFSIAAGVVAILCLLASYFAFRGYTSLLIDLESGAKKYLVQKQDAQLLEFVTKVEHSL
jgi:hypothetical protein